jgi:pilus assembly protein Flp/PilA
MSIKNFLQDEEGQSMVEYGVTLGAVAAVSYIAVVQLGDKTADLYSWMATTCQAVKLVSKVLIR